MRQINISVDLDKTIAYHDSLMNKTGEVGDLFPKAVQTIKKWLAQGHKIWIFTARVCPFDENGDVVPQKHIDKQIEKIHKILKDNGLPEFPVTCIKRREFSYFFDDKAYNVVPNSGEIPDVVYGERF